MIKDFVMTVNFDKKCDDFQGAKRPRPQKKFNLKKSQEECYVENAYEASLENELDESNAVINELEKAIHTVANEKEVSETPKRISGREIFARYKIASGAAELKNKIIKESQNAQDTQIEQDSNNADCFESGDFRIQELRHPNTIRKYVAVLLSFFSNLETEYTNSEGLIITRKLPVIYASREKLISIEEHDFLALANGNTNFLPRASFIIDSLSYNAQRQVNKGTNVASVNSQASLVAGYSETVSAPSPYDISVRLTIVTRGINDALMLSEQIASKFNPYLGIKVFEDPLASTETEVRVRLEGVTFEPQEMDNFSQNEVVTEFNFLINGNLYSKPGKAFIIDNININYSF